MNEIATYTLRIWLYPFSDDGKGYYIPNFKTDNSLVFVAVLSNNHLDILVNEKKSSKVIGTEQNQLDLSSIKLGNISQMVAFQHTSTANPDNTKALNEFLNKEFVKAILKKTETIANGSKDSSSNYTAMHAAVELYNNCESDGNELKGKGQRITDLSNITKTGTDTLSNLPESEPESSSKWKEFFQSIKKDIIISAYNIWTFSKKGLNYQLVNLNEHFALFKVQFLDNGKFKDIEIETNEFYKELESKFKESNVKSDCLNIILAPGDLTKEFGEHLFKEIIQQKVINIDDSDSVLESKSKPNTPLLLICNKAGQEQNFYNASIWSRMVKLEENANAKTEIENALKYFTGNQNLYKLEVAREHFEFQTRLYKNSYLTGNHNTIQPIIFHDENEFNKLYEKESNNEEEKGTKNKIIDILTQQGYKEHPKKDSRLRFNVLLIDDFANTPLKINENESNKVDLTKKQLLDELNEELKYINFNISIHTSNFGDPEVVAEINKHKPDIILLDYNLGNNIKGSEIFRRLLLEDNFQKLTYKGPFDKLWVFPITAFSYAFIDEIRAMGMKFIDKRYHISRGADFINTPYLFKYYFSEMVLGIIKKSVEVKNSLDGYDTILRKIEKAKNWDGISALNVKDHFANHIRDKKDFDSFVKMDSGIIQSLKENSELEKLKEPQLNFYEQLLYNLAYRNFEGNEEIIIFYDLLKKSLGKT